MAIEDTSVSLRPTGASGRGDAAGGDLVAILTGGGSVEARVAGITAGATLRLITQMGTLNIPLAEGSPRPPEGTVLSLTAERPQTPAAPLQISARVMDSAAPAGPSAPPATVTAPPPGPQMDAAKSAVVVALARQAGMQTAFAAAEGLARPAADIPTPVRSAAETMLSVRVSFDTPPDAGRIQQAVARSGVFLEARLAQGQPPAAGDVKAVLLQLKAALGAALSAPSPPAGSAAAPGAATLPPQISPAPAGAMSPPLPPTGPAPAAMAAGVVMPPAVADPAMPVRSAAITPAPSPVPDIPTPPPSGSAVPTAPDTARPIPAMPANAPTPVAPGVERPVAMPPMAPVAATVPAPTGSTATPAPPIAMPAAPVAADAADTAGAAAPVPATANAPLAPIAPPAGPDVPVMPAVVRAPAATGAAAGADAPAGQKDASQTPPGARSETMPPPASPPPRDTAAAQARDLPIVRSVLLALQEAMTGQQPSPSTPRDHPVPHAGQPGRGHWLEPEPAALPRSPTEIRSGPEMMRTALRDTDAALARIVVDQYAASGADHGDAAAQARTAGGDRQLRHWTFDVPVQYQGQTASLRMQVERDGRGGGASYEINEPSWRLRLAFNVEPLGPVRAQVGLIGGRVSVGVWAERPATVAALTSETGQLRDALAAQDFDVDEIHLGLGDPPADPMPAETGLLVERLA